MLKLEQETREKFNNLKKYYDETWDTKAHTLHVGYFGFGAKDLPTAFDDATKMIIGKLGAITPITHSSTILDVGCGTGRTLIELCERHECFGVGVDISDEQIGDANTELARINAQRSQKGLDQLRVQFIQGSGSDLQNLLPNNEQFSHIISQDALLLVADKKSVFENMFRLLKPGGAVGIADFLSEKSKEKFSTAEQESLYTLVNWSQELSFAAYAQFLTSVGLTVVSAEEQGESMAQTYATLAEQMQSHVSKDDEMYRNLEKRYSDIVIAVNNKTMGWGIFSATK